MILSLLLFIIPADLKFSAVPDRQDLRLSESVQLTITIEGPAPLAVTIPNDWLKEESSANWRARPIGMASVTPLPNQFERWTLPLRLDPYSTGNPLPLLLNNIDVRSGTDVKSQTITLNVPAIRVTSTINRVHADEARPITGIEDVPDEPNEFHLVRWLVITAIVFAIIFFLLFKNRRNRQHRFTTEDWLALQIQELNQETNPRQIAQKSAELLRQFLIRKHGIQLDCRTANESLAIISATDSIPSSERRDQLFSLLLDSDRIQFDPHGLADAIQLRDGVIEWMSQTPSDPT